MADAENMQDIQIQKNSKIVVNVDEALPDILVVTYEYGSRIFQGVLLDSTKRNLPFGVSSLNPVFSQEKPELDDRLFSANQRFTYQEGVSSVAKEFTQKRSVRLPARYKNSKMTVRLRPRQVLCSKCRGICNENSENVDATKKRKSEEEPTRPQSKRLAPVTRNSKPLSSDSQSNEQVHETRMCLRLVPLPELQEALPDSPEPAIDPLAIPENIEELIQPKTEFKDFKQPSPREKGKAGKRMVLRKKKSVGSMEDLWDESVFEESGGGLVPPGVDLSHNTRTIKISFGREGEGTVLKIPAKIEDLGAPLEENSTEKIRSKDASSKAARRALKKAKKEARRKILLGSGGSPCYALGSGSPRYALAGNGSPRYTIASASPRHTLGGHSPRYTVTAATTGYENLVPRRHKHKVKHKKKHREDRRTRSPSSTDPSAPDEEIKERCLKQKLSINLKRLNSSAYTRCHIPEDPETDPLADVITPEFVKVEKYSFEELSEYSDEQNESLPDFPPPAQPLHITARAQIVTSGLGADGHRVGVGDVVWGKIHGFPWWPGKVLSITEVETYGPQAHVAWYGSSTSSLMPCEQLSPFLENFKIRYNKKKRGPYKEAIKQATCEARIETSPSPTPPSLPPPPPSLVQPALASPREIDVVS